jgi:hypothetical protein
VLLRYWWAVGDQVRWTIEARMTGPVRPSDDFAYQTVDARVHLTLTVRALVTAVSPADVATVRVSIDRLAGDVDLGAAGKVHLDGDAARNLFVAQADNGDKLTAPGFGTAEGLGPNWTLNVDTLGRVLDSQGFNRLDERPVVRGGGTLLFMPGLIAVARGSGGNYLGSPCTQILGPELPSMSVKPGDEWTTTSRGPLTHCRYVGDETVDGVPCRRIAVTTDGARLEWGAPSGLSGGVPVDVHQSSVSLRTDFWLAQDGCQVVRARSEGFDSATAESRASRVLEIFHPPPSATATWTDAKVELEIRRQ